LFTLSRSVSDSINPQITGGGYTHLDDPVSQKNLIARSEYLRTNIFGLDHSSWSLNEQHAIRNRNDLARRDGWPKA